MTGSLQVLTSFSTPFFIQVGYVFVNKILARKYDAKTNYGLIQAFFPQQDISITSHLIAMVTSYARR